jgi:UDP-glucose 4-epimerase
MGAHDGRLQRGFDEINATATQRLAENARLAGVKRFVFVSSVKVYGDSSGARPLRSDDVTRPVDAYGRSKLEAEKHLSAVCARGAMTYSIVRPPLVYGPGVRANFRRLLGLVYRGVPLPLAGVDNRRSLANVWNLSNLLVRCLEHDRVPNAPLLVCDGPSVSTPQLLAAIGAAMGRPARLFRFPRVLLELGARAAGRSEELARLLDNLEVDPQVARNFLGWQPPVAMEIGIERTVRWYLEQRR